MMRIITGKAKGIRLKTLEGNETRPTAERVKEALFSMIQFDIEGRTVLDLFSGSGQLALEALSRGAAHATMVDRSRDAVRIIRENAEKTRLYDQCDIYQCDFTDFIRRSRNTSYDIVFLDPPYASGFYHTALRELLKAGMLKPTSMILCESAEQDILAGNDFLREHYAVVRQSGYSKSILSILALKQEDTK